MSFTIAADPVPLRIDDLGVARVGATNVTLDSVIRAFNDGVTPPAIREQYDTLTLAEVYAAIAYYLRHPVEVDSYLQRRQQEADDLRQKIESRFPSDDLRERLLARAHRSDASARG
ncbi:MAG: DUF433 domain-containing protein [Chloroflexi bacterium]|nr:DUF433 domain-containing protein [Chloroflexota bacterium]